MTTEQQIEDFWTRTTCRLLRTWAAAGLGDSNLIKAAVEVTGFRLVEPLKAELKLTLGELVPFSEVVDELVSGLKKLEGDKSSLWNLVVAVLKDIEPEEVPHPYLDDLKQTLSLLPAQVDLICLLFVNSRHKSIDRFLEELEPKRRLDAIECACPNATRPITRFLSRTELLRTRNIVEQCTRTGVSVPGVGVYFDLEPDVFRVLTGDTPGGFSRLFFHEIATPMLPLDAFSLAPLELKAMVVLLQRETPSLMLFHGEPGTGKTELARTLAVHSGRRPLFLHFQGASAAKDQFKRLRLASYFLDPARHVLIVDECDSLLSTKFTDSDSDGMDKGLLNWFFDGFTGKAVFVTNSIWGIEDSLLRRFGFTKGFRSFRPRDRQRIWKQLNQSQSLFDDEQIRFLSASYQANPAQVHNGVTLARDLREAGVGPNDVFEATKEYLESTQKLLWGTRTTKSLGEGPFDLDWINVDLDPKELIARLTTWRDSSTKKKEGIGLLFHGVSGTGKTLLGRYLAQMLELPINLKRGSDLMSPYVGETETKIREAFEDAEDGVLMIDEADSFFLDRGRSTRSWERSQTNEILACLEDFKGLFIATTNYQKLLDAASFRRFTFKVAFLPLRVGQRKPLIMGYFPELDWSETEVGIGELNNLTPGDVKAVGKRLEWRSSLTPELVIAELKQELSFKDGPRGSLGFGLV